MSSTHHIKQQIPNLKRRMAEAGYTLVTLADIAGVGVSTIWRAMQGAEIRVNNAIAIEGAIARGNGK